MHDNDTVDDNVDDHFDQHWLYFDDDHFDHHNQQEKDGSEAGLAVQMALSDISEMAEQGRETAEGIEVLHFFMETYEGESLGSGPWASILTDITILCLNSNQF